MPSKSTVGRGLCMVVTHLNFFFLTFYIMSDGSRPIYGRDSLFYSLYSESIIYGIFIFHAIVFQSFFFFLFYSILVEKPTRWPPRMMVESNRRKKIKTLNAKHLTFMIYDVTLLSQVKIRW